MDKIKDLKKVINNSIKKLNKRYIKRKCKINFEDIIYGLSLKTLNSYTFDKVVYELNKKREDIISPSGFKFKNKYIKSNDIQILNDELLNHVYKNKYEKRTLAVDGSYLKTLKSLNKNGLKFSSKLENYTYSIIGGLYDVDKKIIINYNHSIEMNERKSFKEQSKYIRKGDTLLFDRGYYCEDLVDFLNNKKIDYIFRIKSDSKKINFLKNNNVKEYVYTIQNIKYKIVNYNIDPNGEEYYLITSLIYKNIDELKELYKKRWSIETHFKEAKYTTSLKEINSTTIENLLKEINMHNYVYILYYFFNDCIKEEYIGNTCELNHKISLEKFIQDILFILIYKKNIDKELLKIIKILPRTYKHSKKDRHFQRISKRNITRWYFLTYINVFQKITNAINLIFIKKQ
jgi:hypothetical protein